MRSAGSPRRPDPLRPDLLVRLPNRRLHGPGLERDYVYSRALSLYLRDTGTFERLDLGPEVELTHLRHQMTFSGTLSLISEIGEVRSFFGEGKGGQQELDTEHLSSIVEVLNDRFGTDLTDVDKLLLDQFEESWVADG